MIKYVIDDRHYNLSYGELKEQYVKFCNMDVEDFMRNLVEATHLACIICFLKEVGPLASISDRGIIHRLVHLMTDPKESLNDIAEIRQQFQEILKLA